MLLQAAYALCPFSVCVAASVNPSHSISHHMRRFAHADLLYQNEFEFLIWTRRRFVGVCVCVCLLAKLYVDGWRDNTS